jgi:hypothetical protein
LKKREEKFAYWGMQGDQETSDLVIPWARVGSGFYSLFLHCLRVEMPLRCKQAFPREKCLLDLLWSSFKSTLSVIALTAVRDREDEVCSVTASC